MDNPKLMHPDIPGMRVDLHDHQEKAVCEMHNGCVLVGDVGTGKTITALAYALRKESGKKLYVITTAKKRDSGDWEHEAALMAMPVDGIVVDSWNNIGKYEEIKDAFFIFDEQRLVGTGAWVKSFYKIAGKNRWVMLSATPGDTWMDFVPIFIANGFYKNVTEFRNKHVVYSRFSKYPKVEKYLDEGLLQRRRALLLVEMPVIRETTRHIEMVECDYDVELFERIWKKRWHVYEDRPLTDAGELFRVGRKAVASDPSRLEMVRTLLKKHPKLIVFYNFDYELEALRTLAHVPVETPTSASEKVATTKPAWEDEDFSGTDQESASISQERIDRLISMSTVSGTRKSSATKTAASPTISPTHSGSSSETAKSSTPEGHWTEDQGWGERWIPTPSSVQTGSNTERNSTQHSPSCSKIDTGALNLSTGLGPDSSLLTAPEDANAPAASPETPLSFSIAEWNGHKHDPIPTSDSWVYLVQYIAGSEGWNCIETDAMVFYSLTYSYKQYYQSQGRIDRLNTTYKDLYYYVFITKSIVDRGVWRALKMKKNFNVRGVKF